MTNALPYAKPVRYWLFFTLFMLFLMILIGGYTRLTDSGLSITEWAPIMGTIPPTSEERWAITFSKYQETPEFQQVNHDMSLEKFKSIFWVEYFHRLWGRILGLFFFVPLLFFWRKGAFSPNQKKLLVILGGLGLAQAFMGWLMVKSGLRSTPHVSHYRLALHLLFALGIYAIPLKLHTQFAKKKQMHCTRHLKRFATIVLSIMLLTIFYGALVAGLRAGLLYNTYPLMEGQFLPTDAWFYRPIWINFFENPTMVQFCHRTLAVFTLIAVGLFIHIARKQPLFATIKIACISLGGMALLQVTLGIATLLHMVPLSLALLHQGGAILLLTFFLRIYFRLDPS